MSFHAALLLVALASASAFALANAQARINAASGSDHYVHGFLIRAIRANNFRLFTRIPGLLNPTHCAALPLYLHWIFAHFSARVLRRAEGLLNPTINAALVLLTAAIAAVVADGSNIRPMFVAGAAGALALTPQFYHALSARNFGLSARGIGLFLLALVFALAYAVASGLLGIPGWIALTISAYLLWAFSTFAAQALTILGVLALLLFGHWTPLAGGAAGLALFVAIHPRYATSYIYRTLRYIRGYATELSAVYVLARRYSIWRDLVWDVWRRIAADPVQGVRYAYENSVLIVVGLNPLLITTSAAFALGTLPRGGAIGYATDVAICGGIAAFATSFRPTRFLGEPERYVEAVAPFAAVAGTAALISWIGPTGLGLAIALFFMIDLAQLHASRMLRRHLSATPLDIDGLAEAIRDRGPEAVRCAGNNDQLIKLMLLNDWQFVYCMAIEGKHCGIPLNEVFTTYPFVQREALQKIVRQMAINICVLDRTLYDTLFDADEGPATEMIFETPRLRVLRLDWADQ